VFEPRLQTLIRAKRNFFLIERNDVDADVVGIDQNYLGTLANIPYRQFVLGNAHIDNAVRFK
jgi:hypothetical protein